MKKSIYLLVLGLGSALAATAFAAGELVVGATITQVVVRKASTPEAFSIAVTGGTGPCTNTTINFPLTGNASVDEGMRSVALAAYLSGKKIRVYNYGVAGSATDCSKGEYIRIQN